MRKICALAALACLAPAGLGFGPPALIESANGLAPLFESQVAILQQFRPPAVSAASALASDERGKFTFFAQSPDDRRAMASVTKMMTALVALELGELDRVVLLDVDASQLPGSSVMGLRPGEELTLEDLLYGLLLPSGNDAALAIAKAIAGDVPRFVGLMNQRATALGMSDTHFANPHGLDDPQHYSTAGDLLTLARAAMANPEFAKIVGTRERLARGKLLSYQLRNTNRLLWDYPGVDGIKTGTTDAAGEVLVATRRGGTARLFTAVLGSVARFDDTKALLDYASNKFDCRDLAAPEGVFDRLPPGSVSGDEGEIGGLRLLQASSGLPDCRPLWQARWRRAGVRWDSLGSDAGSAVYYVGDQEIGRVAVEQR